VDRWLAPEAPEAPAEPPLVTVASQTMIGVPAEESTDADAPEGPTNDGPPKTTALTPAMKEAINAYRQGNPGAGYRSVLKHLTAKGMRPPRQSVRDLLAGRTT